MSLGGRLNTTVDVDLCSGCRLLWFDRLEDVRLSAAGTLKLFDAISAPSGRATPLPRALRCPRCRGRLLLTHDMQQNTRFQYWRCPDGEGRLLTFVDFLREKDFVRPVTPQQLQELRQIVQTINCSNCGAPVDLARESVCAHCGSPLSLVDTQQMARTVAALHGAGGVEPARADAADADAAFRSAMRFLQQADADRRPGLIEAGLGALRELLTRES